MAFKAYMKTPKRQPIIGTNMPGSAASKKIFGPIDKSPVELNRAVDKLTKGTAEPGAGETAQEDSAVDQRSKSQGPDMAAIFSRGLRGEDTAGSKPDEEPMSRAQRISAGMQALKSPSGNLNGATQQKSPSGNLDDLEEGGSNSYSDYRQAGGSRPAAVIVKKKQARQF